MGQIIDDFSSTNSNWSGTVLVWDEQAIFLGLAAAASLHESPAIKVCVALDSSFGLSTSETEGWKDYDSAIIAAGQPHAIDGRRHKMAMLLLVPETKLAHPLGPIFSDKGITRLSSEVVAKIRHIFADFDKKLENDDSIEDICFRMIEAVNPGDEILPLDSRVSLSIEAIRSSREEGISVRDIAADVELSESRFSHLFTENVRIPVRRYLLWLRLRDAMHLLARGSSLTETAHAAGFSDSAHLTRTFRGMLGIAPSALIKESSLISFLK